MFSVSLVFTHPALSFNIQGLYPLIDIAHPFAGQPLNPYPTAPPERLFSRAGNKPLKTLPLRRSPNTAITLLIKSKLWQIFLKDY
jgi:hypothetical protein